MKSLVPHIATLTLPYIDVEEVTKKYEQGYYNKVCIPLTGKKFLTNAAGNIRSGHSNCTFQSSFSIHEKSGSELAFLSTDVDAYYKQFNIDIPQTELHKKKKDLHCINCHRKIEGKPMGIPVYTSNIYDENGEEKTLVHVSGCYCDFECTLKRIRLLGRGVTRHNVEYRSSESILKSMFDEMHPGEELNEAADVEYLEIFGGSLTSQQYKSKSHTYIDVPSIIMMQSKMLFQKVQNKYTRK